ncbi:MAG: hypothetical protein ABEJ30_09545 [Halorientalis sp.]
MASVAVQILLVLLGVALTFGGLFVYRKGLLAFGALMGLGLGFFATSALGVGGPMQVAAVVLTGLAGVALSGGLYVAIVAVPGAASGFAIALVLSDASLTPVSNALTPATIVAIGVGAFLGFVLRQAIVIAVSAAWGAALVWAGVRTDAVVSALVDLQFPTPPVWVFPLLAVGVVAQATTWYALKYHEERVNELLPFLGDEQDASAPDPESGEGEGDIGPGLGPDPSTGEGIDEGHAEDAGGPDVDTGPGVESDEEGGDAEPGDD